MNEIDNIEKIENTLHNMHWDEFSVCTFDFVNTFKKELMHFGVNTPRYDKEYNSSKTNNLVQQIFNVYCGRNLELKGSCQDYGINHRGTFAAFSLANIDISNYTKYELFKLVNNTENLVEEKFKEFGYHKTIGSDEEKLIKSLTDIDRDEFARRFANFEEGLLIETFDDDLYIDFFETPLLFENVGRIEDNENMNINKFRDNMEKYLNENKAAVIFVSLSDIDCEFCTSERLKNLIASAKEVLDKQMSKEELNELIGKELSLDEIIFNAREEYEADIQLQDIQNDEVGRW